MGRVGNSDVYGACGQAVCSTSIFRTIKMLWERGRGQRPDGPEGGTTTGRYRKAWCGRREPDLERCKGESRRNEEGKDLGNGGGA